MKLKHNIVETDEFHENKGGISISDLIAVKLDRLHNFHYQLDIHNCKDILETLVLDDSLEHWYFEDRVAKYEYQTLQITILLDKPLYSVKLNKFHIYKVDHLINILRNKLKKKWEKINERKAKWLETK